MKPRTIERDATREARGHGVLQHWKSGHSAVDVFEVATDRGDLSDTSLGSVAKTAPIATDRGDLSDTSLGSVAKTAPIATDRGDLSDTSLGSVARPSSCSTFGVQ